LESTPHRVAKFDLTLSLGEVGERIVGGVEYATALFERGTVERYVGHFRRLLEGMVADETEVVDRLPILAAEERDVVVRQWNATAAEYPHDKCVHELFEEQVEKAPEAVAVVYEDEQLTYGELNRRANQLAHYLREFGSKAGPESGDLCGAQFRDDRWPPGDTQGGRSVCATWIRSIRANGSDK